MWKEAVLGVRFCGGLANIQKADFILLIPILLIKPALEHRRVKVVEV